MQVGGGQHRDGAGRHLQLAFGLDAAPHVTVAAAAVCTVLRGRTRKPARVSTASIQSAHIRSSGT